MSNSLKGKTVVITGSGRSIGREMAIRIAAEGASVALLEINRENLEEVRSTIAAAGGDPSILGGLIDVTSTAFTGTPSFDTQNKIKNTINAIRKVALQKGRAEIDAQRNVANRSGFNKEDFEAASDIPEFRPRNKKPLAEVKPFDADKEKRYQEFKAKELAKQSGATR